MKEHYPRTFLVVIDDSPEQITALRYATYRASAIDGRVALLYVTEPHEIYLWAGVENEMGQSEETAAKATLERYEKLVEDATGQKPTFYIRHGSRKDALLKVIEEEPTLSLLVLATGAGPDGPGPLLAYLTSPKGLKQLKIPMIVVPECYDADRGDL